jgi:probable HAF family extracellular repeat protein
MPLSPLAFGVESYLWIAQPGLSFNLSPMKISPLQCPRKYGLLRLARLLLATPLNPMVAVLTVASAAEEPLPNACTFTYTLTDLGTLSGYRLSTGAAINAQGEVVGLCFNGPGDNLARAFLYRRGELIDLGAQIGSNMRTQAASINVRTQIVGLSYEDISSLFGESDRPVTITENDPKAVELGVKFQSAVAGSVTAIRFYKGPQNTGTHAGNLWDVSGTLLATATFSNESPSGWQQVNLSSPVSIMPNTIYVASYHTNEGFYSVNDNYFASSHASGLLTAPATGSAAGNGVYAYGSTSAFPADTYLASNYWVDVVFAPATPVTVAKSFVYNDRRGTVKTFSAGVNTYATSINNHGQIVGYFDQGSTTLPHAFLRQPDGTVVDLGTFGGVEAVATAINNRGQIVGWRFGTDGRYHAFLTGPGGYAFQDLGSLGANTNTYAYAVNNLGDIVGSSGVLDNAGVEQSHAFFYSGGQMRDLGTLGGAFSYAFGINDFGQIVGWSQLADGTSQHAFVYLKGQMRDLNDLLSAAPPGWTITGANGINDRSQIAANALSSDGMILHAMLLSPRY